MIQSGPAVFFDGQSSARRDVTLALGPLAIDIRDAAGKTLGVWPYGALVRHSAPDDMLRLGLAGTTALARLEIREPKLAGEIDLRSTAIDRTGAGERRDRVRVIGWSLAAMISLVLVAVFVVPELAARLSPLVPIAAERQLGKAVDAQVRIALGEGGVSPAECGTGAAAQRGLAAFRRLVETLSSEANLPYALDATVIRKKEANAVALPGGKIYVYSGLIDQAENGDELAAVLAHEVGHVAHRDGVRGILQASGLSFLFGMLLGDFVGGGAVIAAAKAVLQSSYSREAESAADRYGVDLLNRHGWDGKALGRILGRIAGSSSSGSSHFKLLLDHPETRERIAAIEARGSPVTNMPALNAADWAAVKSICSDK